MANVLIEQDTMADIADAIRGKNGSVSTYTPAQMITAIANIPTGGGSPNIQALSVTANGTYTATDDVDGYSPVTVSVSGPNLVTGTFTGTTAGVLAVSIPYSGNGYAKVVVIELADPLDTTYKNTVARYSASKFIMTKTYPNSSTTYPSTGGGNNNLGEITTAYKSSSSSAGSMTASFSTKQSFFSGVDPGSSPAIVAKMNSKTSIKVRITATSGTTREGFLNGITYRYYIIYSS